MPDLYAFPAVRSPQRAEPGQDAVMPTVWDDGPPGDSPHWGGDFLVERLLQATAIGYAEERATTVWSLSDCWVSGAL